MSDSQPSGDKPPQILSPEDLERIPDDLRPKVELVVERFEAFHVPLPPPEVLARYEQAMPGLSQKLVSWSEDQTHHRYDIERRMFEEERRMRLWGQVIGASIAGLGLLLASGLGVAAAIYHSGAAAGIAIVFAIVSVGGPFAARLLAGRWRRETDHE